MNHKRQNLFLVTALFFAHSAQGAVVDLLHQKLQLRFPGAEIEVQSEVDWIRGSMEREMQNDLHVTLLGESPRGEAFFEVQSLDRVRKAEGKIKFHAWADVWVAQRTFAQGQPLTASGFQLQRLDLAQGKPYELRNSLYFGSEETLEKTQARQTVHTGGYLLASSIEATPDVRKGDRVNLKISSDGVVLSVPAVVLESGTDRQRIRVVSSKSKREFSGEFRLKSNSVEVAL